MFLLLLVQFLLLAVSSCSTTEHDVIEKFIPVINPIQDNSYFRIGSYNAHYFATLNDPTYALRNLEIDLMQMRLVVLILQEFPTAFWKSPAFEYVRAATRRYGMPYFCEAFIDDGKHAYGTVFASRYPLKGCKTIDVELGDMAGYSVVEYQNRPINLFAIHLERLETENAERVSQIGRLVGFIKANGLDTGNLLVAVDTTQPYLSDPIWELRSSLPVEDSFAMLGWTRPSYTTFQGITRNYLFLLKSMKGMAVGSYVLQGQSDSFAAVIDLWKYPDQIKGGLPKPMVNVLRA